VCPRTKGGRIDEQDRERDRFANTEAAFAERAGELEAA
jgi:hypothetical protein